MILRKILDPQNKNEMFSCDKCDKSYMTKESLNCHLAQMRMKMDRNHVTPSATITCTFCDQLFDDENLHKEHMISHNIELSYISAVREERIPHVPNLPESQKTRENPKPPKVNQRDELIFKCDECNKSFSRKSCLSNHRKTHMKTKLTQLKRSIRAFESLEEY